jgi:hypothetical protein
MGYGGYSESNNSQEILQRYREWDDILAQQGYPFITRESWGASIPPDSGTYIDNITSYYNAIVIHHTNRTQMESIKNLQSFFFSSEEDDIGYHFVINGGGEIFEGRNIHTKGSHVWMNNTGKIGIALMGNFHPDPSMYGLHDCLKGIAGAPPTTPTGPQIASLRSLVVFLKSIFTINQMGGHRDFFVAGGRTVCPGDTGYARLEAEGFIQMVSRPLMNDKEHVAEFSEFA